jgi:hypothetical protein
MFSPGPRPEAVQCGFPFLARVGLVELPQPQGRHTRASSHSTLQVVPVSIQVRKPTSNFRELFIYFWAPDIFHIFFFKC